MKNFTFPTAHLFNLAVTSTTILGVITGITSQASAATISGFTGVYAPNQWNLVVNTDTDEDIPSGYGMVDITSATTGEIALTGGNNNDSSMIGTTDWTIPINVLRVGTISFNWSYFSLDVSINEPAGYLLNGVFNPIAFADGEISLSPQIISVTNGDTFGFRVVTDNVGGPATFVVSNFTVTNAVPEPLTILGAMTAASFGVSFKRKLAKSKK